MFDAPHPTRMAVAGDPGREEHRVVRGTAVEFLVFADGVATMAMAAEGDEDLEHAGVAVDTENDRIVMRYAAERPLAQAANRQAEAALRLIEERVVATNKEVAAFNVRLDASVHVELDGVQATGAGPREVRCRPQAAGVARALVGPALRPGRL